METVLKQEKNIYLKLHTNGNKKEYEVNNFFTKDKEQAENLFKLFVDDSIIIKSSSDELEKSIEEYRNL